MSYKITCYCNDETIETTTAYISSISSTYSYDYGDSRLGDYEEFSVSGLSENWSTRFTATPASGCSFYRWVYRVGSSSASVQYSYSNPFTYTGGQDIYIRAEGEYDEEEPEIDYWTLSGTSLGTITSNKTVSLSIKSYTLYRRTVTFSKNGTAKFYTTGTSADTYGYLSTSPYWDDTTGRPTDYLKSDDDSNGAPNFLISYNVTAGTTYYVWVRGYSATTTGSTTLHIEPPADSWTLVIGAFGTISSEASASFTLGTNQIRRYSVSFEDSGPANFFTMGDEYTWGYLSTTTGFDSVNGMPTSYLAEDGASGPGDNFAITYNVTAGITYYVWVCESSGYSTGTIELYVQPPEKAVTRPNNFAWTYSKVQGGAFNLTATEWNNLATRINAFRAYKGLSNYSFTTAYSGNNYMAYMYNQARTAIQGISGYGTYIPSVSSGDTITAYMMNVLISELNSIP